MGEPIQTKTYDYVQDYKANTCQAALAPGLFLIDSPGAPSPQSCSAALHPVDGFTATCFRNKITVTILRNISLCADLFFFFLLYCVISLTEQAVRSKSHTARGKKSGLGRKFCFISTNPAGLLVGPTQ